MRYSSIPRNLFIRNRAKLMSLLPENCVAVVHSNDQMPRNGDQTYAFRQNSDLFYLTGIEQERSVLLLYPDAKKESNREILFLLKPDKELEIWEGHKLDKEEATEISGINNIQWVESFNFVFRELVLEVDNLFLNLNEYSKFFTEVQSRDLRFIQNIREQYPLHALKRLAPLMRDIRLQKEPEEIDLIKKACYLTTEAFYRVLNFIRPGVKEYEIEAEITHEFIRAGANGHAYHPIIASGKDNCVLHYDTNYKTCESGELVLMDFGAEYAGYSADTTRTVPVSGKFSQRQKQVYRSVLKVMREATRLLVPGTTINEVNEAVNRLIEKELVELGLAIEENIKDKDKRDPIRKKYYMHGVSHFMGLDVHDAGSKDTVLLPGMVLSCEPGIYIEEEGFGIRLENDILVTDNEPIDLLADEPIDPDEIEKLMQGNENNS